MNFKTDRLHLRTYVKEDIEDVFDIYSNESTVRYQLDDVWSETNKLSRFNRKLEAQNLDDETGINFAVILNNKVIGDISIWYTEMRDTVEIGYTFHHSYTGQGYASEALKCLISYLFEDKDIHRIQANIDARNTASAKLCERVGMRKEAYFIQDYFNKGEWTDSFIYGMIKEDYIQHYQGIAHE